MKFQVIRIIRDDEDFCDDVFAFGITHDTWELAFAAMLAVKASYEQKTALGVSEPARFAIEVVEPEKKSQQLLIAGCTVLVAIR